MIRNHVGRVAAGLVGAALLMFAVPAAAQANDASGYTSCPSGKHVKVVARTTSWAWLYLRSAPHVMFDSSYYLGRTNSEKSYTTSKRVTYWTVTTEGYGTITYAYGVCV